MRALQKTCVVNVPDVGRNEVPDLWTAGTERAFPELGQCPNDNTHNSCISCRRTELSASRFLTVKFNDVTEAVSYTHLTLPTKRIV